MAAYQNIKGMLKTATDNQLKEMYSQLQKLEDVSEILVSTAIETELENRGLGFLNEETFEFEIVC